jgi:LPPG:FO 2-phospho-L-lactate transferase
VGVRVVALAGGVGGAKLVDGLAKILAPPDLAVVVNTGDDFTHLGLRICPDLDTVTYTLAGLVDAERGWGRAEESWRFLEALGRLGGPTWFRLGDRDLAMHAERTRRLQQGERLTAVTRQLCHALQIEVDVLPMSDAETPTLVLTQEGELAFQEYFVARQCRPCVLGFRFGRAPGAGPTDEVLQALQGADMIILCPSNPWVSLDPILDLPGVRQRVERSVAVGVSPLVGGRALRGPAAKMFSELGIQPSASAVAAHYRGMLRGFVIDASDEEQAADIAEMGMRTLVANIVMMQPDDRVRLASQVVDFASQLL